MFGKCQKLWLPLRQTSSNAELLLLDDRTDGATFNVRLLLSKGLFGLDQHAWVVEPPILLDHRDYADGRCERKLHLVVVMIMAMWLLVLLLLRSPLFVLAYPLTASLAYRLALSKLP